MKPEEYKKITEYLIEGKITTLEDYKMVFNIQNNENLFEFLTTLYFKYIKNISWENYQEYFLLSDKVLKDLETLIITTDDLDYKNVKKNLKQASYTFKNYLTMYNQGKKRKDDFYDIIVLRFDNLKRVIEESNNHYQKINCANSYELLWDLIINVKNLDLIKLFLLKNKSLLNFSEDNELFFDKFANYYYEKIINKSIYNEKEQDELKYYKQILYLLLECEHTLNNFSNFSQLLTNINKSIENIDKDIPDKKNKENQKKYLEEYKNFLKERIINKEKRNIFNYMKVKHPVVDYNQFQLNGNYLDLTKYQTISIDDQDPHKCPMVLDDAVTLLKNGETYLLCLHMADASCYVKWDTPLDEDARYRMKSLKYDNYYKSLFDWDFTYNYMSLNEGEKRCAVTIVLEINKNGKIMSEPKFYNSLIVNKKAYGSKQVNKILNGSIKDDNEALIKELAEVVFNLGKNIKQDATGIISILNILGDETTTAFFANTKLPFIYRNYIVESEPTDLNNIQQILEFIKENRMEVNPSLISELKNGNIARSFYDTKNYGHNALNVQSYGNVGNSLRDYISLESLRGIKEMVIKKPLDIVVEEFARRYEEDSLRANAVTFALKMCNKN